MENSKLKTALIAGATGLTGSHCLHFLLKNPVFEKVISVGRRPTGIQHPKLQEAIIDLEVLHLQKDALVADAVFCCLGTTIKKAGSKKKFRKVDFEYPMKLGELTVQQGAHQFLLVSAMGADKNSFFFYNKVKGELEEEITKLPFRTLHIFRPSLLLGDRAEVRTGETAASAFFKIAAPAFKGPLKKYKAIEAKAVAGAMVISALRERTGTFIHHSDEIQKIYDHDRVSL